MRQLVGEILEAAAKGDTRAVLALVKSGTNPNTANARGETAVYLAAENGHTKTVLALVQECRVDANTPNLLGRTPVYIAAENGHTKTVLALVQECDADASTPDLDGHTPVYIAALFARTETVLALVLECIADANTADNMGKTPVLIAAMLGRTETVRALVLHCAADASTASNDGYTPVTSAARYGRTETVRALVKECGADPDTATAQRDGYTPVCFAASYGHTETVLALVKECGADPNAANRFRNTPVYLAAANGHTETARALVHFGADPFPALLAAAQHDDTEMIWTLVRECGVDPACRNRDGERARDLAPPRSRASRACKLLECLEEWQAPGHAVYTQNNADKRVDGFECPVCLEDTTGHAIAFVPCGHRVCPGCWAGLRARNIHRCPQCRAPIWHGAPPISIPDQQRLFSRFCVELPRACVV
jgi:ankyrin repeat protein